MLQLNIKSKGLYLFAVLILCTGLQLFMYGGNTAVGPLLTSLDGYQFYSLVSALGSAGTMIALPAVGAIGNKIGRRNVVFLGVAIMLAARTAIQFSGGVYLFMVWQTLGSFGAGLIMSAPYAMIAEVFERTTAMKHYGLIATFNAIGSLTGPLLAGVLVDAGYLKLPFIIWIPLIAVGITIIAVAYPNVKRDTGKKFDTTGLIYLAVLVASLVLWLGLSGSLFPWLSAGLILPVLVVVMAILLFTHSNKISNPTVPLYIFKYKRFRAAFFSNILLVTFSTCASGYVLIYILYTMQKSTTLGSTSTMPSTILIMICGLFMGRILAKNFIKNIRVLMILCAFCILAALSCFCLLQPDSSMALVWIGSALGGIGNSIAQTCLTPFFQFGLPPEDYAAAQGMYTFSGTCGSTVFVAVVGVLVNLTGGNIKVVFYSAAFLALINVILVLLRVRITDQDAAEVAALENK